MDSGRYFVVRDKAVPDVLLKVVQAKKILNENKSMTVSDAVKRIGISRSSFYKYQNYIFPFNDTAIGRTMTLSIEMIDTPGVLSDILQVVASYNANILTIHQSIPINGVASTSLSVELFSEAPSASAMVEEMERIERVQDVSIVGRH